MKILFESKAWEDYEYWQNFDKKMVKKINAIIKECLRSPFEGMGKPEALRYDLAGYWSRRIDAQHRLVYKLEDEQLIILQCRFHYS